jgi:segregation and condensation protein A
MLHTPSYTVRLPVFEGPLDLLLHLIEREELDITKVALAQVTDQYLSYLLKPAERSAADLAAFVVVAAKLLLIKSRALLPQPPTPAESTEDDMGDDLVRQLRVYRQFKEIALQLREREQSGLHSYVRIAPLPRPEPHLDLSGVALADLVDAARRALSETDAGVAAEAASPPTVTIGGQITRIETYVFTHRRARFVDLLSSEPSRVEIIVTLLALLELLKRDLVAVFQDALFGDILIEPQTAVDPQPDGVPATLR